MTENPFRLEGRTALITGGSKGLGRAIADAIRGTGLELVVYSACGHTTEQAGWERRYLSRLSGTLVDGAIPPPPMARTVFTICGPCR